MKVLMFRMGINLLAMCVSLSCYFITSGLHDTATTATSLGLAAFNFLLFVNNLRGYLDAKRRQEETH